MIVSRYLRLSARDHKNNRRASLSFVSISNALKINDTNIVKNNTFCIFPLYTNNKQRQFSGFVGIGYYFINDYISSDQFMFDAVHSLCNNSDTRKSLGQCRAEVAAGFLEPLGKPRAVGCGASDCGYFCHVSAMFDFESFIIRLVGDADP